MTHTILQLAISDFVLFEKNTRKNYFIVFVDNFYKMSDKLAFKKEGMLDVRKKKQEPQKGATCLRQNPQTPLIL